MKYKTNRIQGLLISTILFLFTGNCLVSDESIKSFWESEGFQKKLLGGFAPNTKIEPAIIDPEEQIFFREVAGLIYDNRIEAIAKLEAYIKPEASAVIDYTLGSLYLQEGSFEKASKHFDEAIKKFPDFRRAHKNRGFSLVRQQQLAEASSALTRAVELGEWDDAVFGLMGFCHLGLERYASALNAYNNAILLAPENADWKLGIIKSQVGIGNFKEALSMLDELIEKSPDNSKLWELQAGVFVQNNDLDKALINYELLREMGKLDRKMQMFLGDLYMTLDQGGAAVPVYSQALAEANADLAKRGLRAAEAMVNQGEFSNAKTLFSKLRQIGGQAQAEELKLLRLESKVAMAEGREISAIKTLEEIVVKNPLDGDALMMIGDYHLTNDENEKAFNRYQLASRIEGFQADAQVKMGQVRVQQRKYNEAIELIRKAQELRPRDNVKRFLESIERVARQVGS